LSEDLIEELNLFCFDGDSSGAVKVVDGDAAALRDRILAPKYNFGAPAVFAKDIGVDGSLTLVHEHATDGRGLDLERAERVLEYLQRVWRRPVKLLTVDLSGKERELTRA
jgi:stage V sporulation protein R